MNQKPPFPTILYKNVYDAICMNPIIKYSQIEENLGIGESSIHRAIGWLKENGYINSERSKIKGVWQIEKIKRGFRASFLYLIPFQIRSKDCLLDAVP